MKIAGDVPNNVSSDNLWLALLSLLSEIYHIRFFISKEGNPYLYKLFYKIHTLEDPF
jgi:hypothetical protein